MDKGKREWLWFLFSIFPLDLQSCLRHFSFYPVSLFPLLFPYPFPFILYPFSLLTTFLPITHHV